MSEIPWFPPNTAMWFVDFMREALYNPTTGYYRRSATPIGRTGDFMTAPELTPLFGQVCAVWCEKVLATLHQPVLLEFGAGAGTWCVAILQELEKRQALPEKYCILEVSAPLQAAQRERIQQTLPHLLSRVEWLTTWPEQPFEGLIIANEVLDAMPVHRFRRAEGAVLESRVWCLPDGRLEERWEPSPPAHATALARAEACFPHGERPYVSEVNEWMGGWLRQCFDILTAGGVLILDYGYPQHEYYHPDRDMGTLMCYHQHRSHTDPFCWVGEQDLSAHVDFTRVAEVASEVGFSVAGFLNQATFLLEQGLLTQVQQLPEAVRLREMHAVNQLLSPAEMGELIKVIWLTKHCDLPLTTWWRHDQRGRL